MTGETLALPIINQIKDMSQISKMGVGMTVDNIVQVHESARILQYFDFRPDLNARRMVESTEGLCMPRFPVERFLEAVDLVIKENADCPLPYGTGHLRAGLNYAMSPNASLIAHQAGLDENMFVDAETRTYNILTLANLLLQYEF